jgi:NhaP-type Na+/H+ or K+/H+ antiporter
LTEQLLIALASIITLGIAAVWVAWRIHLPSILLLLVAGVIAGPVTGFLNPDAMFGELLFPIVSISVAIILFEGGASLQLSELREIRGVVRNLVTVGALATWGLSAGAAHLLIGLPLAASVLLGAILVVTGPTVIIPLLRHVRPTHNVAHTLKWEGILIDPVGAVLAVLVFQVMLSAGVGAATTAALLVLLKTIVVGGVLAIVGAGLMVVLLKRGWVPDFLQSPLALMLVVAAFAASNMMQTESGLLTATLMGVLLANQKAVSVEHIIEFKENLRVLLISSLFIVLAARLQLAELQGIGARELAFLAALILVVRPAAAWLSTLGSEFTWRERTLLAWVAPRGIVAAAVSSIFALELQHAGYAGAERLVSITFMVIIATVAIYGLTAGPLARLLGLAQTDPQGILMLGAHPWAREIAAELKKEGIPVRLVDNNYSNIAAARMTGLSTYYGSALTEGTLAAINFSEIFGTDAVYQLPPQQPAEPSKHAVARHLRGRFLFDRRASYWDLTARFDAGAAVKSTNLTETFDYETFKELYREAIPLFLIGENGHLLILTVNDPPEPEPRHRLVAVVDLSKGPKEAAPSA